MSNTNAGAEIRALRAERAAAERQRGSVVAALDAAVAAKQDAQRRDDAAGVDAAQTDVDRFAALRDELTGVIARLDLEIDALRFAGDGAATPEERIAELRADLPVALLPVRIETRFLPAGGDPTDLWIRVYPDDIHLCDHEPGLTEIEIDAARQYWEDAWRAADDADRRDAAWQRLTTAVGGNRAKWVVGVTTPTNADAAPAAPVPADEPLDVEPALPAVDRKAADWTQATWACALPDRFVALGHVGGQRVFTAFGNAIPDRLPAGLAPDDTSDDEPEELGAAPADDGPIPIDDGILWLTDLAAAEKNGMAIRVPLQPNFAGGLDVLVVLGVRSSEDGEGGAELVTELIRTHEVTDGFELLRVGAPTNNAAGERAAFSSSPLGRDPFRGEPELDGAAIDGSEVGVALAEALGLPAERFESIPGAGRRSRAGDMHAALWSTTLGYYVQQMLLPLVPDETVGELHDHFVTDVRGRGPLPSVRAGAQPYGVLPVVARGPLQEGRDLFATGLVRLLDRFRGIWIAATDAVPRITPGEDPRSELTRILGMTAGTQRVRGRSVYGKQYLENLWQTDTSPISEESYAWQRGIARMLLQIAGVDSTNARIVQQAASTNQFSLRRQLVAAGELSEIDPLDPNYIADLVSAVNSDDAAGAVSELLPRGSLLYMMLRHSVLLALGEEAARLHLSSQGLTVQMVMEPELIDVESAEPTITGARFASQAVAGVTGVLTVGEFLGLPDADLELDFERWVAMRQALARLVDVPSAELGRLFTETLDLTSYRLDAWYTSLAMRRLRRVRQETPRGLHVGAYGFVEDLAPAADVQLAPAPAGHEPGDVIDPDTDGGFVHAPSLGHATTAAVLRSGFLAHGGAADDLLAIDLSSSRTRTAQYLLEGIRQGQPIGAILGYRFERHLHVGGLQRLVLPLRELAPLIVEVEGATDPIDARIAGHVVNGEKLAKMAEAGEIPFGTGPFPASGPDRAALDAALAGLIDAVDAVADLLLAESVYQTVQGNPVRAAAALDVVDRGAFPPDIEVARTPRTGVTLTQRIAALVGADDVAAPGWPAADARPRSLAEPRLNRWAGSMLGDPAGVDVVVAWTDADGVELADDRFALGDVGLCPLDVVLGLEQRGSDGPTELELRLLRHAHGRRPSGLPASARAVLVPDRGDHGLGELAMVAAEVGRVATGSRPVDGRDLAVPEEGGAPGVDVDELANRADAAVVALDGVRATLEAVLGGAAAPSLADAMLAAADFGVPDGVALPDGDTAAHAPVVLERLERMMARLDEMELAAGADAGAQVDHHRARLEGVFGEGFVTLPVFSAANAEELGASLAASPVRLAGDELAPAGWLLRAGLVRDGAERLGRAFTVAETLTGAAGATDLAVVQLPHVAGERWIGLDLADDAIPGASVSIVVHGGSALVPNAPMAGLLVDEWLEVIPRGGETTGVAFHFDQPDAVAPNCIALAVPAGNAETWDLDALEATVLELIDLARIRSVDIEELCWIGRYLPALYVADNPNQDTYSISFQDLFIREVD